MQRNLMNFKAVPSQTTSCTVSIASSGLLQSGVAEMSVECLRYSHFHSRDSSDMPRKWFSRKL